VLSQNDVREFFRRARRVSYKEYAHDLDMSRCHVTGKVVFANGDRGEWNIDRERRGLLTLSDGRNVYFYCKSCGAKAFGEP
jgi:outer membrane lipoprotein-sorting protein